MSIIAKKRSPDAPVPISEWLLERGIEDEFRRAGLWPSAEASPLPALAPALKPDRRNRHIYQFALGAIGVLNRRQTLEGILHNQVVFRFAQLLVGELHPSYPCAVTVDAGINCLRATDEGIEAAVRLLAAKPDSDYLKLPVAAWIIRMRDSEKYESHALPDDFPHPFMVQMRERLKWGDIKTALDLAQFRHQPAVSDALALNIARLVNEIDKDGIARVVFRAAPSPSRLKQKWGLEGFEPGN